MALGDWHRTLKIGERVWYAGTPEPDRHASQEIGKALLVDIETAQAPPVVREIVTGEYRWTSMDARVEDEASVRDLEARLRAAPDTFRTILRLHIEGSLALAARADLQRRLEDLAASFFDLETDLGAVTARPTAEDFDSIDFDGVLRKAAERLKARAAAPNLSEQDRRIAQDALVELYLAREGSRVP